MSCQAPNPCRRAAPGVLRVLFLNLFVLAICVALLWFSSTRLSESFLQRIEIGMPVKEVIEMLGRPSSEQFIKGQVHEILVDTERLGKPYIEFRESLTPMSAWKKSIVVDTPNLFPREDWMIDYCLFWEDGTRIFWITFDDDQIVKSKRLTTISSSNAAIESWRTMHWRDYLRMIFK